MAKSDESSIKEMIKLEKQDVLILGDFGIQLLDIQGRMLLMEIIEDRHGKNQTSSPHNSPRPNGMKSSMIRPWQMQFWTESYMMYSVTNYRETLWGNSEK